MGQSDGGCCAGRDSGTLDGMDTPPAPVSSAPPPPCSPGSRRAWVMRCGTCLHRFQPGGPAGGRRVHRQRRRGAEASAAGNGYLIQDSAAQTPLRPDLAAGFWYFATASGQAGLRANVRGIAEVIWRRKLPVVDFRRRDARPGRRSVRQPRLRRHRHPLRPASARPRRRGRIRCAHPRRRSQAMSPRCPSPGGVARSPVPSSPPTWWPPVNRSPHSRRHREPPHPAHLTRLHV
jgi:hypothetical protein